MAPIWGKLTAGGAGLALGALQPSLLGLVAGLSLLVLLCVGAGVVLPAIWSKNPGRRKAAKDVLRLLLSVLRRPL